MRIFCVGQNYKKHIEELNNAIPTQPVIFIKPDTSLLTNNRPFYIPAFSENIDYEVELVIKINKIGKNIDKIFASRYFEEVSLGIDFTARDVQLCLRKEGLPWEKAKAFDFSAPVGFFLHKKQFSDLQNILFSLEKNGKIVQQGNTNDMLFSINEIISHISTYFTLKLGDLIFTGTPHGVGQIEIGDKLIGRIGKKKLLDFCVK